MTRLQREQQRQTLARRKQEQDPALEAFLKTRRSMDALTKADVGLSLVDNTPDVAKPVSDPQQDAIDEAMDEAIATAQAALDTLQATITAALLLKSDVGHTHSITQVVGLSDALSGLSAASSAKVAKTGDTMTGPLVMPTYLKVSLPSATTFERSFIYVSDLTGGAEFCYSDGTNWRRISDRSVAN